MSVQHSLCLSLQLWRRARREAEGGREAGPGRRAQTRQSGRGVATPRFAFISLYNIHFFYRLNSERTTPVSAFADCPVVRDHLI